MKHTLWLLIVLLSGWNAYSQNAFTIYNTVNSPLPENSVRAVAIDQNGIKWVGTDYGLAEFNDTTWTIYQSFNSGIPDNSIRCISVDKLNNKWIGTQVGGLAKFDGTTWTVYNQFNSGIPDNFVRCIELDTLGNVWAGTFNGLCYFDGSNWTVYNTTNSSFLYSNNIGSLHINPINNALAVGTINGGMALNDGTSWSHFTIWDSNLPDNTILGLDMDSLQLLWMATPASGVSAYLGGILFSTYNTFSSTIPTNGLTCIKIAADQSIYLGSLDSGLIKKNDLGFISYNTLNSPMPDNDVQTVAIDPDGVIWLGTQVGGLVRIDVPLLSSITPSSPQLPYTLYPVPAVDKLNITSPVALSSNVEVKDVGGRVLFVPVTLTADNKIALNTSSLVTGIYFVKMSGKDGTVATGKFQVIH